MGSGLKLAGLITAGYCGISTCLADLEVSATVQIHAKAEFEAPLSAHGTWVEVGSYGRCWHPVGVAVEWRPYCTGEWVWTDCGWYWESDEPWGWACYHYGYWVIDPAYGWVWVPGVEWAPAWVSWRVGGGYIGWAPLAPSGFFFAARPKPEVFVFVNSGHFGGPVRPASVIVKNNVIFTKTAEVGGVKRETRTGLSASAQRVMVNNGPKVEEVQRSTGRTFRAVPIQEAARKTTVTAAAMRHGASDSKAKTEVHGPDARPQQEAGRSDRPDNYGRDADGRSSGGPWQGSPGGGHGNGSGGHGKGHG